MLRYQMVIALSLAFGAVAAAEPLPRLRVHEQRRILVTEKGEPFFWLADTAWEMLHRLNREETLHYLDTRAKQGFNVIQTVLIAELDGLNVPNRQGHRPLRDNDPMTPATADGPDNDYWDDVDWVLDRAAERRLYVALLPTWGEWVTPRFVKEPIFARAEQGYAYGHILGNRWKDRTNLVWILGGDRQPTEKPHAFAVWRAMAEGIADGTNGGGELDGRADWSTTLMTYHSMTSSSKWWHADPWLDFHSWGTYHSAKDWARSFQIARADYAMPQHKPTLNAEPCYEAHPMDYRRGNPVFTAAHVRRAAWWSVMSGCLGHTYGADGVWMMAGPPRLQPTVLVPGIRVAGETWPDPPLNWRDALKLPGAQQMIHLRRFFESRAFLEYAADQSLLAEADEKQREPVREDHVSAGRGKDWLAVYSPMGRAFTLQSEVAGKYRQAAWYNPRDGRAQAVAEYDAGRTTTFAPPTNGDDQDWVLVLDGSTPLTR